MKQKIGAASTGIRSISGKMESLTIVIIGLNTTDGSW